jgi:hypothetical protein
MKMKAEKSGKPKEITDEMIGEADKICACSAVVGEIILATNEAKNKKAPLKGILTGLRTKKQK